jgi:hypothetical protein
LSDERYTVVLETSARLNAGVPSMVSADEVAVTGNYFSAIGTPLLQGRPFNWSDTSTSEPVAIIDQILARKIAPGTNPIGQAVRIEGVSRKVVGIAAVAEFRGLDRSFMPLIYVPLGQAHFAFPFVNIVARVEQASPSILRTVQAVVLQGGNSRIKSAEFAGDILAEALHLQTNALYTTGILAAIGFALSIIGMSAAIAYTVSRRQHDVGIRLALGATTSAIGITIFRGALIPVLGGIFFGLILASWSSRQIRALLYGVQALDVGLCLLVSLLLIAAAVCTVLFQVRRLMAKPIPALLRVR